jgi:hypothetical protein
MLVPRIHASGGTIMCSDVCVRGHQESNLRLRPEDRSRANAPQMSTRHTFNIQ